jgi:phytoene dehydrogenase-like protein
VRCASLLGPQEALIFWRELDRTRAEIARYSAADAQRYPAFAAGLGRLSRALERAMGLTPPALPPTVAGLLTWATVAARVRLLGRAGMMELLRWVPNSAAAVLDDWFEDVGLKGALASLAVSGSPRGPRAHGSAFLLLYHGSAGLPRSSQFVQGGTGELSQALARSALAHGAEVRTGQAVERILLDDGRAVGVQLRGGAEIRAAAIASSADPRSTLLELIPPMSLEVRVVRRARNIRFRGSTARVNLALDRLPAFPAVADPSGLTGHLILSPDPDYLERAADDAKYGRCSVRPYLDMTIPTLLDPARAPEGKHILTITMQYAPYDLREADWDRERERLGDRIVSAVTEFAPELPATILHRQVLTPLDYEREYGLPEGCIYHGEMGLDQLASMRPIPGYGSYRAPVEGLFFCGAGAHPGGGVSGAPGRNAAREIVRALRRRSRVGWGPTGA